MHQAPPVPLRRDGGASVFWRLGAGGWGRALRPHDREMYTLSLRAYRDHLEPERISMARENAQFYRSHPDRAAPASAPSGPLKM